MNEQAKYFGMSAGVHAVLFMLLALTAGVVDRKSVVTIDFSLNDSPPLCETKPDKPIQPALPNRPRMQPEQVRQAVAQPLQPTPQVSSTPAVSEPAPQPVAVATSVQPVSQPAGSRAATGAAAVNTESVVASIRPAAASSGSSVPSAESSAEQVRKKYLKEHFNYIRNLIVKRLAYPPIARKMEWSGKVTLAFVVAEDGDVRSVQIKESSGYPILDNSAVDTVKKVAPFPRPPVAAEIVIPVQFKLE